jgi:AcrR family transcriptional regulator
MDTRSRILDAALACFAETGYTQATIARIRERSGVSNGALFHQFPTKEAIADALYLDVISSFQQGLWDLLDQRPRSLRAAVRGVIAHQIGWIEGNVDRARFVYARGNLDWASPAGAELGKLNRELAGAFRQWMAPFVADGRIRPMPMLVLTAVVAGPTHAIARRWLAGQAREPLHSYTDQLTDAATAALTGTPVAARRQRHSEPRHGRVRLQLSSEDGGIIAEGEATVEFLPFQAGPDAGCAGVPGLPTSTAARIRSRAAGLVAVQRAGPGCLRRHGGSTRPAAWPAWSQVSSVSRRARSPGWLLGIMWVVASSR